MHAHEPDMANQNGRNGPTRDDKDSWRNQSGPPRMRRDDEESDDRDTEYRGMGQSGYGAGRAADDRSLGTPARNTAWGSDESPRGRERGPHEYGRGRWEEGRIGVSQGYGYEDSDRPSFERGIHDSRFGGGPHEQRGAGDPRGAGGPYGGGGYEPDPRGYGTREQNRYGGIGYGEGRRPTGSHRGKGPKGFEFSDERVRERVCEALSDDHNIDATNIEVSVHKGEVTLTGSVDDRQTKRMAEDCVLQCSGVRDVHNQLRVHR